MDAKKGRPQCALESTGPTRGVPGTNWSVPTQFSIPAYATVMRALCMSRHDRAHAVFHLDPPCGHTEGCGVAFEWAGYEDLAVVMPALKGATMLINDHPASR